MGRPKQTISEYRNYALPPEFPVIAMEGEEWLISPVPSTRLHFHNCLEIGLCVKGSGGMNLDGEMARFSAGSVTWIAPHVLHTTFSSPGSYSQWSYLFLDADAVIGPSELGGRNLRFLHDMVSSGCFILDRDADPQYEALVRMILEEMRNRAVGYHKAVRSLIQALTVRVLRVYHPREQDTGKQTLALTPALDYVHRRYMEAFSMDFLADLCHLSPSHFRRLFYDQIGTTPLDFVHQVRVAASCALLVSTTRSVTDIAHDAGYISLSCFNRHFFRITGMTPSQWRHSEGQPVIMTYNGWQRAESSEEILRKND